MQNTESVSGENAAEPVLSQGEQVEDFKMKIETLCQSLSSKIEKKNEGLIMNHEHYGIYEATLNEKYNPVFQQMRQKIKDKKLEYTTFLNRQLSKNEDRITAEKVALEKL